MKLSKLGEFGLIEKVIAPEFKELVNKHLTGIGDDCAIIPISDDTSHLHTTDMLVEKTHFLRDKIAPYQLGFKSLAVNLSDIAAMGGRPLASYLSIALPKDTEVEWMEEFMRGYRDLSEDEDVPLLGGDTTSGESIVINVGVTGEIDSTRIKKRSAAKEGDIVCLTGVIGDSAGGLQVILDGLPEDQITKKLLDQHLTPWPHVSEGLWLARHQAVHAMIDVSDGIGSDLHHILKASSMQGTIDLEKLPISAELKQQAGIYEWNPWEMAVSGGEDYVLLLTVSPEVFDSLARDFEKEFERPLYPVGTISRGEPRIIYKQDNREVTDLSGGYTHF